MARLKPGFGLRPRLFRGRVRFDVRHTRFENAAFFVRDWDVVVIERIPQCSNEFEPLGRRETLRLGKKSFVHGESIAEAWQWGV